jgi:hypothetical protein
MKVAKLFNYLFGHLAPLALLSPLGTRHHFPAPMKPGSFAVAALI